MKVFGLTKHSINKIDCYLKDVFCVSNAQIRTSVHTQSLYLKKILNYNSHRLTVPISLQLDTGVCVNKRYAVTV